MTGSPRSSTPPPPAPGGSPAYRGGAGTILFIMELLLASFLVLSLFLTPLFALLAGSQEAADAGSETTETAALTGLALIFTVFVFQAIQGGFPWLVEFRRGRGLKERMRFTTELPNDLGIGFAMAVVCFIVAQVTTVVAALLVGLEDSASASNTDILEDNQNSLVLAAVIFFVVVGAPLAEELLFRGLILRNLQRWFGGVTAIIVSSALFAVPHWQPDATWQETTVLLTSLGVVGLVLAIGAVKTNRLGPAIIAHFFFNLTGTVITLAL